MARPGTTQEALDAFHRLMVHREHRFGGPGPLCWARLMLVALIPVFLLVFVAAFAPEPIPRTGEDPGRAVLDSLADRARSLIGAGTDVESLTLETIGPRMDTIAALQARLSARDAAADLALHQAYRAKLFFLSAYALFAILAVRVIAAQRTVILRHAATYWPRTRAATPQPYAAFKAAPDSAPRLWVTETFLLGLSLGAAFALVAPHALPWLLGPETMTGADRLLAVCAMALGSGLVLSAIHVTASGTRLLALNYPPAPEMRRIARAFENAARAADPAAKRPESDGMADMALDCWTAADPKPQGLAPVDRGMTAIDLTTMVNAMSIALVVVLVSALTVLSLGLDLLELRLAGSEALRTSAARSVDAWVLTLGVGFTITMAFVQIGPVIRLSPFEIDPPQRGKTPWTLSGKVSLDIENGISLEGSPPASKPAPAPFPEEMERYLGATRGKFHACMEARKIGAAFHTLLQDTLLTQIKRILGLLAPAVAGTLLSFLG